MIERQITDGQPALGPNPWARLGRSMLVFAILGGSIDIAYLMDRPLATRVWVVLGSLVLGLLAWGYLEVRNRVIATGQAKRTRGWKLAALALHPAMLPVYLIGFPILIVLATAWWQHNHGKDATPAPPSIEKPQRGNP